MASQNEVTPNLDSESPMTSQNEVSPSMEPASTINSHNDLAPSLEPASTINGHDDLPLSLEPAPTINGRNEPEPSLEPVPTINGRNEPAPSLEPALTINSHNDFAPSLEPPVPEIIVTKPTPLIRSRSTTSVASDCCSVAAITPPKVNLSDIALRSTTKPVVPDQTDVVTHWDMLMSPHSRAEVRPVRECVPSASVPFDGPVRESGAHIVDLESVMPDIELDDDLRNATGCCPAFMRLNECEFLYRCSSATESKFFLPVWILLMALPVSAGFMGARYLNECRMSPGTPMLLFMLGISGVLMITARILLIVLFALSDQIAGSTCLQVSTVMTFIITLVLFCTEFMSYWRNTPSFEIASPQYCDPTFYQYVKCLNWTVLAVVVLMLLFKIPKCMMSRPSTPNSY